MSEKNSKVFGCVCEGTGIDPTFQDACKCTQEVISEITEKQAKYLQDLTQEIKTNMGDMKLAWTEVKTKKQASEVIDLLMVTKALAKAFNAKESMLTDEQKKVICSQVAAKPTKQWVNAANKKLASIGKPETSTGIAVWRQAKINTLIKELGSKLSDEQKAKIKAKMATEGDDWAQACINKLLKIKSS